MTPRRSTAIFDHCVIVIHLIVLFHTVRIWSCRTQSCVDVSVSPRTPSLLPRVYSTDSTCPTATASESGTLKFSPFPDQFEKWAEWQRVGDGKPKFLPSCLKLWRRMGKLFVLIDRFVWFALELGYWSLAPSGPEYCGIDSAGAWWALQFMSWRLGLFTGRCRATLLEWCTNASHYASCCQEFRPDRFEGFTVSCGTSSICQRNTRFGSISGC